MAKYVFGIDLGTTYSCISYVDEAGKANIIKNMEGDSSTPSVVNFASPTEVVVGQIAKENAVIDPENTSLLVKTLMGRETFAIHYNGEDKSPEEVSAYILRKVAEDASKQIDAEVKDVVITCPAFFGTAERTATKNAGKIAGLNVLEVISEPTAAALYYGCAKEQDEKTILVYDLGGGTFDVTIMNISSDKIEVICSDGNHELGGKDWDEALMRFLAEEFVSETGFDGDFDAYSQQDLRLKAEKAKQQLTSMEQVPVMIDAAGLKARVYISRDQFDEITSVLLAETIEKTDDAIKVAKDKGYEVDEILLVGGSTRMPQVTKALIGKYDMEPKILEPDEAVAKGASIHAVNVYINNKKSLSEFGANLEGDVTLEIGGTTREINADDYKEELAVTSEMMSIGGTPQNVVVATTKSFAVETIYNGDPVCWNLIIKNEPMEDGVIVGRDDFGTLCENQNSVEIKVYESDFMEESYGVDEDFLLGTASLDLPENLPKGAPIEIRFELNTEGILQVRGVDKTSNNEVNATMHSKGIMAEEKVNQLAKESKQITVI